MALVMEDLRRLGTATLEPLMDEEEAAWLDLLGWDYSPTRIFLRSFIDRGALPGFALLDRGRAVGYTYVVFDGDRGVIGALYVQRSRAGEGLEQRLAAEAIRALQDAPFISRIEAQLMIFTGADVEPAFKEAGMETFQRHFLSLDLDGFAHDEPQPTGFELRPWDDNMLDGASRVVFDSYVGGIDAHFSSSFGREDRCRGFVKNLVRHAGCGEFLRRITTVGFGNSGMAGIVVATRLSPGVGHLPQISVAPEAQGNRIGAWLVDESLKRFRRAGYSAVSLTVTESNERAYKWYRRLGFEPVLPFKAYLWRRGG